MDTKSEFDFVFEYCGLIQKNSNTPSPDTLFQCKNERCKKILKTRRSLAKHVRNHNKEKVLICDVEGCRGVFSKTYALKAHRFTHWNEDQSVIPCIAKDCSQEFRNLRDLRTHLTRNHKISKGVHVICKGCNKQYLDIGAFLTHYHSKHVRGENAPTIVKQEASLASEEKVAITGHPAPAPGAKPQAANQQGTVKEENRPSTSENAPSLPPIQNNETMKAVLSLINGCVAPNLVLQVDAKKGLHWIKREDLVMKVPELPFPDLFSVFSEIFAASNKA